MEVFEFQRLLKNNQIELVIEGRAIMQMSSLCGRGN
jgi:hypothetical protein